MSTESWILFIGFILIIWGIGHLSSQINIQTRAITDGIASLKDVLEKEESTDYTSHLKYDANDIYKLLEDYPEKIAKEIKHELGYRQNDVLGLEHDMKDIRSNLVDIEKALIEIQLNR